MVLYSMTYIDEIGNKVTALSSSKKILEEKKRLKKLRDVNIIWDIYKSRNNYIEITNAQTITEYTRG